MYLATELFPNSIVNEAVHKYSVEQSIPVPSNLEQHRRESVKWAEENGAQVIMFVHPLQVTIPPPLSLPLQVVFIYLNYSNFAGSVGRMNRLIN